MKVHTFDFIVCIECFGGVKFDINGNQQLCRNMPIEFHCELHLFDQTYLMCMQGDNLWMESIEKALRSVFNACE